MLIKRWEKSDGIDFAIALARLTGWMLQVDWLTLNEHDAEKNMIPVRVYVETNRDIVFDFTGKRSVMAFHKYIIRPIAFKRSRMRNEHIATRCYSEEALRELPLKVQASEDEIQKATDAILAHATYLNLVPKRLNPEIPAYIASGFSHGNCVPFAHAFHDVTGLPAVGIEVSKYADNCANPLGFCHSVILHPDGQVEDSWGKQPLAEVLERFYIREYRMNPDIYYNRKVIQMREYPDRYHKAYELAISLLNGNSLGSIL